MLKNLNLKSVYYTENGSLIEDFFIPALSVATNYDRAVGYFSASLLFYVSQGLSSLIQNNGKMRLIIGTSLTPEEEEAVLKGYSNRERLISNNLNSQIDKLASDVNLYENSNYFWRRISSLTWMIENNFLDIKVAIRRNGIFHEKIGIIKDVEGDLIVFQGSANETLKALHTAYNYESLNVFKGWIPELQDHIIPHVDKFEKLWSNNEENTLVLDFPVAAREYLAEKVPKLLEPLTPTIDLIEWNSIVAQTRESKNILNDNSISSVIPKIPDKLFNSKFILKDHQKSAIDNWFKNSFRGIMELCTGAGKTITAIYSMVRIFETSKSKRLFIVICVPYINLAEQWGDVLSLFNIYPIFCYDSVENWYQRLQDSIIGYNLKKINFQCVLVVNKTMKSDAFQETINMLHENSNFLWIGDEVHHHDSPLAIKNLPEKANLRLGLSATVDGCKNIEKYYGESVAKYTLEDALKDEVLCNYDYYPQIIYLNNEEKLEYMDLYLKIAPLEAQKNSDPSFDSSLLDILYSKRNDLIGNAASKLSMLFSMVDRETLKKGKTLFYCSSTILDGSDEKIGPVALDERQIDNVVNILNTKGLRVCRYTSRESKVERRRILENFKNGDINCLVAIRCLDEGVDIPAVDTAYILASSSNSKQFIQRRGRVLRKSQGKDLAKIYDFVVSFEAESELEKNALKKLMMSEIKRVKDFASLSNNFSFSWNIIKTFITDFDIS